MISGRSELAKAIRYARSRWTALTRYLDDGMLEISNNAAERAIRPLALGRKNYLFARSYAGGERAAIAYALIEPPSSTASILKLFARGGRPYRRPSHQPDRRTAALEHRRCIADPRCSLIFAISLVAEPRELPAPRSYRNRLPL